jgi:hypothetical protein
MHLLSAIMEDLGRLRCGRRRRRGLVALAALWLSLVLLPHAAHAQSALNAVQSRLNFDHLTTGFELIGQHRDLPCESCHVNAIFKGTPTDCAACHGVGTLVRATAKPKNHILATDQCGACHTPVAWNPAFIVDHTQVRGNCSSCHNGTMAQGKGSTHVVTDLECDACHTTLTWAGAMFNHAGVTSGCAACHDNVHAMGVTATHVPIGTPATPCESCHSPTNYNTWKPGVINHPAVSALTCASCHETANFQGMRPSTNTTAGDSRPNSTLDRIHPTTGDCIECHNTISFLDPTVKRPSNHIPTAAVCSQCHTSSTDWSLYSVTGTHQGVTGCAICHGPGTGPFAGPPPSNTITIVGWPGSNHIPIGSADCGGSGCHTTANVNPGGFKIGAASTTAPTLTVAGHSTIAAAGVAGCSNCHQTAPYLGMIASTSSVAGDSRPPVPASYDASHPTTGDCGQCHGTSTFAGAAARPSNHIPTTAACGQCHTTAGNYAVYSVTGTHQGVTGCLSCHGPSTGPFAGPPPGNTITIVGWPGSNHIPIGRADCNGSGCHSTANVNPGGFKIGTASTTAPTLTVAGHSTIAAAGVAGCQTCHETAPYTGMMASSATAWGDSRPQAFDSKHPATGDCGGCHLTTPTFMTNQSGSGSKPSNHIPTNAPCAQCHTTAANYAAYVMGATGHAGITNNCAQCHAYGLSFANMAAPTLKQPTAGPTGHIPAVPPNGTSAVACELCHSPSNFTTFSGTIMRHAYVVSMQCMACHEWGMTWQTNVGVRLWTRDGPNHYKGRDCGGSGCHSTRDKMALRPGARPTPTTPPTTPKAGTTAARTGATTAATTAVKPPTHIASTNNCQSCHTTVAWLPVRIVDHSQVIGTCVSCHNGVTAPGKPSRHVATSAGCERCHTTNAWTPARFDHAAVTPHTCTTCHNAVQATGLPRTHIPTTQQCDVCHGTLAWKPAKVDHSAFVSGCAGCHNNVAAVGMTSGHMSTRIDCSTCHSYPDWAVLHFRHVSAAYPGDHRVALSCTSCHSSNTDSVPWRSPANAGSCAGCHAADFKPAAHPKTVKGQYYTVNELANCSGACHVYSDSTQSTITRSLPGPYHRVSDATFRR